MSEAIWFFHSSSEEKSFAGASRATATSAPEDISADTTTKMPSNREVSISKLEPGANSDRLDPFYGTPHQRTQRAKGRGGPLSALARMSKGCPSGACPSRNLRHCPRPICFEEQRNRRL